MQASQISVSVVIPTCKRPSLLLRAVASALGQTFSNLEVIVVVDGNDPATQTALKTVADPRLKIVSKPVQEGANQARNSGIAAAQGKWIALLDDDDEWFPNKLEIQIGMAEKSQFRHPVVACYEIIRTPRLDFILPRRIPGPEEPISEYLFTRRGLFHGDGFIQSSMMVASRELFLQVPMETHAAMLHETTWLLKVAKVSGVGFEFAPETLAIWNVDENRTRESVHPENWKSTFEWITGHRELFTPRAYAAVLLTVIGDMAAMAPEKDAFRKTLSEALRHGRPGIIECLIFSNIWLLPPTRRRQLRDFLMRLTGKDSQKSTAKPALS